MAHITKRNSRWQATYRGPDKRERTKTFSRKIDAEKFLTSIEHSKLAGTYVDPAAGKTTFRDFAEEWRKVQLHRPGTERSVEQQLRLHVYPVLGDRSIGAIRPSEVQGLVQRMGEGLSASTVKVAYGRVVAVFRAAVRDRVIAASPCVGIRLPLDEGSAVVDVLEPDQVQALADAVLPSYRALIVAGAGLGLRPGELFGLALDRVDFLRRSVRVDQQVVRQVDGSVGLGPLKSPASYRTVPLPDVVGEALAAHLAEWPAEPDRGGHPTGVIFRTRRGGFVQQHPFAMVWEVAKRKCGAPSWATPHDLRHFYASALIRSGLSVKVVQVRLGHASAKTTLDTYGHLWPDDEDRTRSAVDSLLGAQLRNPADFSRTFAEA
jgi:integrase